MKRYEKLSNAQLINLCECILRTVRETENRFDDVYHQQDWQDLENAVDELQRRAGMNNNLEGCDSNNFDRIIEKAISKIKTQSLCRTGTRSKRPKKPIMMTYKKF